MPERQAGRTHRPPVEGKVPAPAVVAQPVTEVITLVLKCGYRYIVLEGQRVGEGTLSCQPRVWQEAEVAGAEPSLP